jgi:alkylation response protein AidB-like acyl-CoA dehydrogenase
VEYVDGGVKLSGQWNFGSGILWDAWAGLGAIVKVPGFDAPQPCLVTVKTSDIEVIRNWDPFGLRATGSHGVKATAVFVPWHRVLPLGHVKETNKPVGGGPIADAPIYRIPFMPMFCVGFGALAVGVAQRVVDEAVRRIQERQRVLYGVKDSESAVTQRNVGELLTKLHAIEAMHERYVEQLETWDASRISVVSDVERHRLSAWRAWVCREASELAFRALEMMGGSAAYTGDPLEMAARDLFMNRIHAGQIYDDIMLGYGRTEFGLSGHPML